MTVSLSGAPREQHEGAEGTYMLGPNTKNGKRYYLQIDGQHALWYGSMHKDWGIGLKRNLGTSFTFFITDSGTARNGLPYEVSEWLWSVNRSWVVSTDIVVQKG